ncbi:Eisosome protein 1 [Candida viswanathii]|uniref:Eisosome protein 1 n=1 Tax=Candida viswanathii TaxID=5486 RepID=A0A367YIU6_9ASCO|nr:Eisosome protein 1 [Candida viswanathii]
MSYSAYKPAGKPLSAEALYHQRLKQGVFQSPSGTIVGVNSNASDTAALLAASSDLTVQPSYVRSVAPEAHNAALAAKQQEIVAWERGQEDPDANAAANNARRTSTLNSTFSAAPPSKVGIPSLNSTTVYKAANANSTSTMSWRTNPDKDIRRTGLQTKQQSTSLNIDKINKLANKNSTKSLSSRFNPELDYRSGLKKQPPTEFLDQDEEDLAASSASASLKHGAGLTDQFSAQKRSQTFQAADVVNASLLKAANEKANLRLNSIKSSNPATLKAQAQLYANALALAQKRSDERVQNYNAGLVNLGGGLTISQTELDNLASTYVQPILNDIEGKALAKRQVDLEKQQRQLELKQKHESAKAQEKEAKAQQQRDLEIAKLDREAKHSKRKETEDANYVKYQAGRNKEIDDKEQELKDVEAKHAEEKEALLKEKQENQERIDKEEADKVAERKKELDDLQAEKDEEIKPTLDELAEETEKLKEVTNARDELANEVKASEDLNKEYEEKIAELESKLEETKNDIEKYTTDLETATGKHETTDKELSELQELHDKEKSEAEKEHEDLDAKLEQLEKEKQGHIDDKAAKKKEILAALDDKVKDEHKINSELPEHLRVDVNEDKIRDTSSLFSVEKPEVKNVSLTADIEEAAESKPKTVSGSQKVTSLVDAVDTSAATAGGATAGAGAATAATAKPAAEAATKPAATTAKSSTTTPVKRAAASSAPKPEPKKKTSFSRRLSSIFKYTTAEDNKDKPATSGTPVKKAAPAAAKPAVTKTAAKSAETTKPAETKKAEPKATETKETKAEEPKKEAEPKQVQPAAKDAEKEAKEDSEFGDFEDDISLNKKENKGGVFTEEI